MNNTSLKFMFLVLAVGLAVSQAPAQGYLICPLPDAPSGGGTTSLFDPSWNNDLNVGQKIVPVVFHLIGTSSSLQDIHIQLALDQLNADFNSPNIDWDIEFRLAGIGPTGECANGITRNPGILTSQDLPSIKVATRWDNTRYLNVWVLPLIEGDPLKWGVVSSKPSNFQVVNGAIQRTDVIAGTNADFDQKDGVVIKEELIYPNPSQIHTLAHEVGHWLNLLHPFSPCESGGSVVWNCCHPESEGATNGDFIFDTPPQHVDYGQSNCSLTDHYCNNDGVLEDLSSYMGYAFAFQNKFTLGQREWMFHCLLNFRLFIWSAENLRCAGVGAQSNVEITQPTDWNFTTVPSGFVTIKNELRIKNGGILNIAPGITVQFCDLARAIVEPGGNLQLFGTLTNTCQGKLWQGVEVQGTPAANQFAGNLQGRFKAHPNSVVSNAVTGVKAGGFGFGLGGGIVQCTLATFRDNQRAVQFNPYENHLPIPSVPVTSNVSYFTQCEFITDSDYPGFDPDLYLPNEQVPFFAFADLLGVRGIRFSGCNFINEITYLPLSTQYGIGILSKESSFTVGDYCTGNSLPCPSANQDHCLFKNLYNGIWATKTDIDPGLPHRYSVTNATFDECWTGIRSSQGSRCYIVGNKFELGDINTDALLSFATISGIYMDFVHTNITVQENLFKLDENATTDILDTHILLGTDIFFIGQANNAIRKNTYKNLSSGNHTWGEGAEPLQTTGLHYLCNINENNALFDFDAQQFLLPQGPPVGLRSVQGLTSQSGGSVSAGNIFSHISGAESDFSYRAASGIRYFFPTGVIPETPLTFTPPPKIVLQNNTPANNCESILCDRPPCKSEEQLAAEKLAIAPAKIQYNSLRSLYLSNPTSPEAQTQMASMTALQEIIQGNTFDILTDIVANEAGTLLDYRYWLGNMDAYETDLELARSYEGTGESSAAVAKLNEIASKYQLSGDLWVEFNQYQVLLAIVRQHYQTGGDKYNFPTATLGTFQWYAENSPHARVRGLAKQLLAIYGILYPSESSNSFGGGGEERQALQSTLTVNGIQLVPNPASQTVAIQVDKNLAKAGVVALVTVVSTIGTTVIEQNFDTSSEYFDLDISGLKAGVYYVWIRLGSGESFARPLSVIR